MTVNATSSTPAAADCSADTTSSHTVGLSTAVTAGITSGVCTADATGGSEPSRHLGVGAGTDRTTAVRPTPRPRPQPDPRFLHPGDQGYAAAVTAWNSTGGHQPGVVVLVEAAEDVVDAVRYARRQQLGVGVMATGHGTGIPVDAGGLLINTSRMRDLHVDPTTRLARVQAGVTWAEVNARAARHGLIGLQGSNSIVGVVGYTVGGGFGWLGRRFGFASQSVVAAELVTADGDLVTVTPTRHPDLFWALRGGAGNVGIVIALTIRLYPLDVVYGGALFYPMTAARSVLTGYAEWSRELTPEMSSSVAFVNFPPLPFVPEQLRGKSWAVVRACYSGPELGVGVSQIRDLRHRLGQPALTTVQRMPALELDQISMEPKDPLGAYLHTEMLDDLTPEVVDTLLGVVESSAQSPLLVLELRHLGGALDVPEPELSPLGRTGARFTLNALALALLPQQHQQAKDFLGQLAGHLCDVVTGSVYVNFLDGDQGAARIRDAYTLPDWQRLRDLKGRYDPGNLFRFNRNIRPRSGRDVAA